MANFATLEELLNTTSGMTVLRNNSGQDDGVDTVTGVNWFTFNGVVASNIYVSGNSFVGFGSNTEHLKVCRRDGKMWYLYRQEGTIGNTQFLKIRWQGYTQYNQTSATYALIWELFLFDDGGMYLNLIQVPTSSSYLGTSQLICGSKTYSFTVAVSTPVAYSFLPQGNGTFVVSTEIYPVFSYRVPSGSAEFTTTCIRKISNVKETFLLWDAEVPENTTLKIFSKLSSGVYTECENGGVIAGIDSGADLSTETLYFKVEMTTNDPLKTPTLRDVNILIFDQTDSKKIVLEFPPGVLNSIQRAVGDITIAYDGSGTLMGQGGPVLAFEQTFTPVGLDPKNNPHNVEHLDLEVVVAGALKRVVYSDTLGTDHIDMDVSVVGILTHVDDL